MIANQVNLHPGPRDIIGHTGDVQRYHIHRDPTDNRDPEFSQTGMSAPTARTQVTIGIPHSNSRDSSRPRHDVRGTIANGLRAVNVLYLQDFSSQLDNRSHRVWPPGCRVDAVKRGP